IHQKRDIALLECYPHTGRTHQIRVHLTSIGLSILGDSQYGSAKQMASRMMLHAASLKFIHPIKNEMIHIQSALPLDFTHAMHRWGIEV
ncbi:MAG: hypothetical protein K9M13_04025, partial [Simkaniaceae bacterium]|nr:hypothetical protein [Simkaniaceae bacterium]